MQTHGGARPGSGRKPQSTKNALETKMVEDMIRARIASLTETMFELAQGAVIEYTDKAGNTYKCRRPPDRKALEYLLNRIIGAGDHNTDSEPPQSRGAVLILPHNGRDPEELFEHFVEYDLDQYLIDPEPETTEQIHEENTTEP